MNRRIVEEGSRADGDGRDRYAARRRNLACRPSALGRLHGAHESLPNPGGPTPEPDHLNIEHATRTNTPGHSRAPTVRLDWTGES